MYALSTPAILPTDCEKEENSTKMYCDEKGSLMVKTGFFVVMSLTMSSFGKRFISSGYWVFLTVSCFSTLEGKTLEIKRTILDGISSEKFLCGIG